MWDSQSLKVHKLTLVSWTLSGAGRFHNRLWGWDWSAEMAEQCEAVRKQVRHLREPHKWFSVSAERRGKQDDVREREGKKERKSEEMENWGNIFQALECELSQKSHDITWEGKKKDSFPKYSWWDALWEKKAAAVRIRRRESVCVVDLDHYPHTYTRTHIQWLMRKGGKTQSPQEAALTRLYRSTQDKECSVLRPWLNHTKPPSTHLQGCVLITLG